MRIRNAFTVLPGLLGLLILSIAAAQEAPNVPVQIYESIEKTFSSAMSKADADLEKAKEQRDKLAAAAAAARLAQYQEKLKEVTKTGDFDKAVGIKARIEQLEKDPELAAETRPKKARPKDAVRFNGHWYALIKDAAPWHVAKHRCEEMGGHLVTIETPAERIFVETLCIGTEWTWAGGTDEEEEGHWVWVTGKPFKADWIAMDLSDEQHYLGFNRGSKKWYDCNEEHRTNYVCEWDR